MGTLQNNPSIESNIHILRRNPTYKQMGTLQNNPSIESNIHILRRNPTYKQMGTLQNNPSIGWMHPKSTHARPLAWGQ